MEPIPAMSRRNRFDGRWCELMRFYVERRGLTHSAFAASQGQSQQAMHAYLTGKLRPPRDGLDLWYAALRLSAAEIRELEIWSAEAATPANVWTRLLEAERQLAERREAATPAETVAELRSLREANKRATDALQAVLTWAKKGRGLPPMIAETIRRGLMATQAPTQSIPTGTTPSQPS